MLKQQTIQKEIVRLQGKADNNNFVGAQLLPQYCDALGHLPHRLSF